MGFKVMGVTAGRKDSNCEILLKEALLVCQEQGAKTEDGKWRFVIAANGLERDRTSEEGRGVHCDEIADTQGGYFMDPEKQAIVAERLKKYKAIRFPGV